MIDEFLLSIRQDFYHKEIYIRCNIIMDIEAYLNKSTDYCESLTRYRRFPTREVMVGQVGIGGKHPIRIQSMTTTNTMDTTATVEQSIRMIEAGCELVRITAPSKKDAENLQNIKDELRSRGYDTPLIADIHYTPNAAEIAAQIVEKVRINPGNYADRKKFQQLEYTDASYQVEIDRLRDRFVPLVTLCKKHGTAMRIGTNHGSLSHRIMSWYGDTPMGMVESAMEFVRICREEDYHDIILSMKASNPQIMVQAYRLLVAKMKQEGMNYPLHLGVTEAGEGADGRIKSAVGIGTLLEEGLGDTIRVSLTEEPEAEIPVAKLLISRYDNRKSHNAIPELSSVPFDPFRYEKRNSRQVVNIGGDQPPRVVADYSQRIKIDPLNLYAIGYLFNEHDDKWSLTEHAADFLYVGSNRTSFKLPGALHIIQDAGIWHSDRQDQHFPLWNLGDFLNAASDQRSTTLNFIHIQDTQLIDENLNNLRLLKDDASIVLIISTDNKHSMAACRRAILELVKKQMPFPVIWHRHDPDESPERTLLNASTDVGGLLLDGFGDGVWLESVNNVQHAVQTSFGILQATRTRISRTEYISCPSCGRTLFDLQETTARIRARTNHLKGVKIGIMGCIVNGPGEMADADYGYVGTGVGKIALYKGQEIIRNNIPEAEAVDALINLIREYGDWHEPPATSTNSSTISEKMELA